MNARKRFVSIIALMSLFFSQTAMFAAPSDGPVAMPFRYYMSQNQLIKKDASWLAFYEKKAKEYKKLLTYYKKKYAKYEAKGQIRSPNLYNAVKKIGEYQTKLTACQNWIKLINKAMRETGQTRNLDIKTPKRYEVELSSIEVYVDGKKVFEKPYNVGFYQISYVGPNGELDPTDGNAPMVQVTGSADSHNKMTRIYMPAGTKYKTYYYNGKPEVLTIEGAAGGASMAFHSDYHVNAARNSSGGNISKDAANGSGVGTQSGTGTSSNSNNSGPGGPGGAGGSGVWIPIQRLDLVYCSDFALPLRV